MTQQTVFCYRIQTDSNDWQTEVLEDVAEDIHTASLAIVQKLCKQHSQVQAIFRIPANLEEPVTRILSYKAKKDDLTCTDLGSLVPKHKLEKIFFSFEGTQTLKEVLLSL